MNRHRIAVAALAVLLLAGCQANDGASSGGPGTTADPTPAEVPQTTAPGQTSAQAILADIRAHGFKVSRVREDLESTLSGARETFDATVEGLDPVGVLVFGDVESARSWADLADSFGGVVVLGDTWALSLPSDTPAQVRRSRELARRLAAAIGGTVR
jgi:hypothetical protein